MNGSSDSRRPAGSDRWLLQPLACFTLLGFAIAQPLFDLLQRNPVFLLEHAAGAREIAILMAISWLGPGLVLGLLLLAIRVVSSRIATGLYLLLITVFVGLTVLPLLHSRVPGNGWIAVALALALGAAAATGFARSRAARWGLSVGAVAPVIFSVAFLLHPSTRALIDPSPAEGELRPVIDGDLRPFVLVILDEVPTTSLLSTLDRVDEARFPNLAAFAADAVWFRNCTTVSSMTHSSVPAILTAKVVREELAPSLANYPANLIRLLQHDALVVSEETLTQLAPEGLRQPDPTSRAHRLDLLLTDCAVLLAHRILPESLAKPLPSLDAQWGGFGRGAAELSGHPAKFLAWIERLRRGFRPLAGIAHTVFPHQPYVFYGDGTQYADRSVEPFCPGDLWVDDPWPVRQSWSRSLQQLELADTLIGRLVARLREEGLYDDAVIAITADHGASYRPGDHHRRLTETNAAEILLVPFLLKLPRGERAGTIDDRHVTTVDIVPTLGEAAGFRLPWSIDGRSFLSPGEPGRPDIRVVDPHDGFRELELPYSVLDAQAEILARQHEIPRSIQARPEWTGRALGELQVGDASRLVAKWEAPPRARRGFAPGELRGIVESELPMDQGVTLAFVREDTVIATTKSVRQETGAFAQEWVAWFPRRFARPRIGSIRAFEVDGDRLRPIERIIDTPSILGRRLGLSDMEGVVREGVYPDDSGFRGNENQWTRPLVRLFAPLREGESARELEVRVDAARPGGSQLSVQVAGRELFRGSIPEDGWTKTFRLEPPIRDSPVQIELSSTEFVPSRLDTTSTDDRTLGLLLSGIWLR